MSKALLITLKEARPCRRCGEQIMVGQKAVKSIGRDSSLFDSGATTVYLHEECWKPNRNQNC